MRNFIALIVSLLFFSSLLLRAESEGGQKYNWTVGVNVTETASFLIAKQILGWPVTFVPIHLDGAYAMNQDWGLAFGLVYRYENYGKPLTRPFGKTSMRELWTNYHELFLMAGPRYSFFGEGSEGLYVACKLGVGGGLSPGGFAITAVGQPELGYNIIFGDKSSKVAFNLDLAAGILLNMPIFERPYTGFRYPDIIGLLVHRTIPIIRVGVGMAF